MPPLPPPTADLSAATADVLLLDEDLVVLALTPGIRRALGFDAAAVGRPVAEVLDDEVLGTSDLLADLRAAADGEGESTGWQVVRCNEACYRLTIERLAGVGISVVAVDMTDEDEWRRALRRRAAEYDALVSASAQMVWRSGPDGAIAEDCPAWRAFTGQSLESWMASRMEDVVHPQDLPSVMAMAPDPEREPEEFDIRFRLWHAASDDWRWVRARGVPLVAEDGSFLGHLGMTSDVHDARVATEELRASERRFRALVEASADILWRSNPDGTVPLDGAWRPFTGFSAAEEADGGWVTSVHPDDREGLLAAWAEAVSGRTRYAHTYRLWHAASGAHRWIDSRGVPVWTPDGAFEGFVGMDRDVTDERAAAEALRLSERRFRALVDASSEMFFETDESGRIVSDVPEWQSFTGQARDEYAGEGWFEAVHPDDREPMSRAFRAAAAVGGYLNEEFRVRRASDGAWRWMSARAAPLLDDDGDLEGYVGMNLDVTERREAQAATEASERRFRALVEAASEMVWQTDADGLAVGDAPEWCAYTGQTREDWLGEGWAAVVHPDDIEAMASAWRRAVAAEAPFEWEFRVLRALDDSWRWAVSRAVPLTDADGTVEGWVGTTTDVHDEHEATEAVAASERRFRALVEASAEVVWQTNAAGDWVGDSPSWERFTGQTRAAASDGGWFEAVHPDDRAEIVEGWTAIQNGNVDGYDGTEATFRILHQPSQTWRWVTARWVAVWGADGTFEGYVGMNRDVTDEREAAEGLRESERRFRTLVDVTSEIVWEADLDGAPIGDTTPWQRFTGQAADEVTGFRWADAVHPDDRDALVASWGGEDGPRGMDFRLRRADGEYRWVSGRIAPVVGPDGRVESYVGMNVDITDEREAAEALREAERRFRALVEVASEIVWETGPDGAVRGDSGPWRRFTGQSVADWRDRWHEAIHPEDRPGLIESWEASRGEGVPYRREFRVRRADGEYRWMLSRAAPLFAADGTVEGYIGMNADVTDQREAADALLRSERRFRTLVDVTSEIIWESKIDGRTIGDTSTWRRFTGQSAQEMAGMGWMEAVHPDDRDALTSSWDHSFAKGRPHEQTFRLRRADGEYRWMDARGAPIYGPDGEIESYIGMNADVTEEREAVEALRESEARFRALIEASSSIVWQMDASGEVADDGATWEAFTGQPLAERVGGGWADVVHPDDREDVLARWQAVGSGVPDELDAVFRLWHAPSGGWRWVATRAVPLFDAAGTLKAYIGMATDVTEQREAAEAVAASERRFRALVESSSAIVWEANTEGEKIDDGRTWEAFTGQSPAERARDGWFMMVHPDDRGPLMAIWNKIREGDPAEASDRGVTFRLWHAASGSWRWVNTRAVPLYDADGATRGYIGMKLDVTEQREAAEAVAASERRFRALVEASAEIVWQADTSGEWTDDGATWEAFTGQAFDDRAGRGWLEVVHPDDRAVLLSTWGQIKEDRPEDALDAEVTYRLWHAASRSWRWMTTRGAPMLAPDGTVEGYVGMNIDVTEQHEAAEAVRASEHRFRTLVAVVAEVVWELDLEGRLRTASPSWEAFTGQSRAESWGYEWLDAVHPDDKGDLIRAWVEVTAVQGEFAHAYRVCRADGSWRWMLGRAAPLRGADGAIEGYIGMSADVTDLHEASEALRESEASFRSMADTVPGVLFTVETSGEISYISTAFTAGTGVDAATFERPGEWEAVVHPDDWPAAKAAWKVAIESSASFEARFRLIARGGGYRWHIARARYVDAEGGRARWFGTAVDIEDLVAAEQALQNANETLEARVEAGTARIRELATALAGAEQAERRRIAQVLHDDLQQQQYGLAILLAQARDTAPEPTAALLARCEKIVEDATAIGRGLVAELSPSVLDSNDVGDLARWLATEARRLHGLSVEVEVDEPSIVADSQSRAVAHQVLREALFNVVKHAGVSEARLRTRVADGRLVAEVVDSGAGFDPAEHEDGFGLRSIRDRLILAGGRLEVSSVPGRGTTVRISLPTQ